MCLYITYTIVIDYSSAVKWEKINEKFPGLILSLGKRKNICPWQGICCSLAVKGDNINENRLKDP